MFRQNASRDLACKEMATELPSVEERNGACSASADSRDSTNAAPDPRPSSAAALTCASRLATRTIEAAVAATSGFASLERERERYNYR